MSAAERFEAKRPGRYKVTSSGVWADGTRWSQDSTVDAPMSGSYSVDWSSGTVELVRVAPDPNPMPRFSLLRRTHKSHPGGPDPHA